MVVVVCWASVFRKTGIARTIVRERERKRVGSLKEKQSYLKGVSNRNVFVVICWGICTRVCNFLSAEYFFLDRTFFGNKRFIRVENRGYIIIRTRPLCDKF